MGSSLVVNLSKRAGPQMSQRSTSETPGLVSRTGQNICQQHKAAERLLILHSTIEGSFRLRYSLTIRVMSNA